MTSGSRRFNEIGEEEYPDIKREYYHVDATCMWMVKSPGVVRRPGDRQHVRRHHHGPGRLSPRAGWVSRPGATSTRRVSACSSPSAVRRPSTRPGVINAPVAAIVAGAMMLDTLGETQAAQDVEGAVADVTGTKMKGMASGQMGYSTSEVGDLVA